MKCTISPAQTCLTFSALSMPTMTSGRRAWATWNAPGWGRRSWTAPCTRFVARPRRPRSCEERQSYGAVGRSRQSPNLGVQLLDFPFAGVIGIHPDPGVERARCVVQPLLLPGVNPVRVIICSVYHDGADAASIKPLVPKSRSTWSAPLGVDRIRLRILTICRA
jgi:hypothetical protein